jgi:hypothetical protein
MLWRKQPAPGVGDAVRAATDVGEAPKEHLHGQLRFRSGTVWATPLEWGSLLLVCSREALTFSRIALFVTIGWHGFILTVRGEESICGWILS